MKKNFLLLTFLLANHASCAFASTSSATGLSFLDWIWVIISYLQGPVATGVAIIGIIGAGIYMMLVPDPARGMRVAVNCVIGVSLATTALGILGALGITTASF